MNQNKMNIAYKQKGVKERVTGRIKYVSDLYVKNVLHGKFVRLQCGRAKIKNINVNKALLVPGVIKIYTSNDFANKLPYFGPMIMDQPILAATETKFEGEPVAIVIAESERAAIEGVKKVKIDYEVLPAILDIEQALSPNTFLIHNPKSRGKNPWENTNIMGEWKYEWGDVDAEKKKCKYVIENTYRAPFIHHFALERYTCIALPENGEITILAAIQHPFVLRQIIADMLGFSISRIRVKSNDLGGGFGGRGYPKIEPAAAFFAWKLQRPVKISLTAEEGFMVAQREAAHIKISTGFNKERKIVFQDIVLNFLVGAYDDIAPKVVSKAGFLAAGPYRTPNARIIARGIYTNTAPSTAFRGFGGPHCSWAVEGQIDQAARILNIDPVELRLRNLPKKGETLIPGAKPVDGEWASALKKTASFLGWNSPKKKWHGKSIAIGIKSTVPATISYARVTLNYDNSLTVYIGTTEMGQGARTTMSKIVSQCLSVPLERISIILADTSNVPFDTITASSRSTVCMGSALVLACNNIKDQLKKIVAEIYSINSESVTISDGMVCYNNKKITLSNLLKKRFGRHMGEITGEGKYEGLKDSSHPLGGPTPFFEVVVTGTKIHINPETGFLNIDKVVNVSDAGKVINLQRAIGVDEGGVTMGIGAALSEQIILDKSGHLLNGSSLDYRIPTIADIPEEMITLYQENEDGPGPFGSKGLGEGGILAVVPAICGAVYDATNVYIKEIPLTSEKVWRVIHQNKNR